MPIELKELKTKSGHCALRTDFVTEVTLMRMTASLVMRVVGTGISDSFKTEAEALEWLDVQLTQLHRKR